jgi:hypothetical protein
MTCDEKKRKKKKKKKKKKKEKKIPTASMAEGCYRTVQRPVAVMTARIVDGALNPRSTLSWSTSGPAAATAAG